MGAQLYAGLAYKFGYSVILHSVSHHILGLSLGLPSPKALYGL